MKQLWRKRHHCSFARGALVRAIVSEAELKGKEQKRDNGQGNPKTNTTPATCIGATLSHTCHKAQVCQGYWRRADAGSGGGLAVSRRWREGEVAPGQVSSGAFMGGGKAGEDGMGHWWHHHQQLPGGLFWAIQGQRSGGRGQGKAAPLVPRTYSA